MKVTIPISPETIKKFREAHISKATLNRVQEKALANGMDVTTPAATAFTNRVIDADIKVQEAWDDVLSEVLAQGYDESKIDSLQMGYFYRTVSFSLPDDELLPAGKRVDSE